MKEKMPGASLKRWLGIVFGGTNDGIAWNGGRLAS